MSNTLFPSGATALSTTKRIEWIDALRGFTMILVVFSHIETLGFEMPRSTVNDFFSQFRMPLFFFISGFIAFRAGEVWNRQYFTRQMLKKMRIQIIPTLFFGLLFAITVFSHRYHETAGDSIFMFFDNPSKLGYWFTIALLAMFVIYYTVSFVLARCRMSTRQIVLAGIAVVLYLISLAGSSTIYRFPVARWFSLFNIMLYFQFFVFGNIFACYQERIFRFLQRPNIIGSIILLFFGLYIANSFLKGSSLMNSSVWKLTSKLLVEGIRYLGIMSVVSAFRHYEHAFSSNTRIGRSLQYIGKRTLDVYLLHYFLMPNLTMAGAFFCKVENTVLQASCSTALALLVIAFCLLLSNFIRTSPTLAYYLFGVKRDKTHTTPSNNPDSK